MQTQENTTLPPGMVQYLQHKNQYKPQPDYVMKRLILLLTLSTLLLPTVAAAESVLTRINKIDTKDAVELYCSFTTIPVFRSTKREKRVDFILEDTILADDLELFKEDGKIVKILSQHKNNKTILSFFFRYPPQKFEVTPNESEQRLVVRILLGNPYSSALPGLSAQLSGLTIVERTTKDYSNPLVASPYAADWRSFFKLYEADWEITVPVQYTVLPFPAIQYLLPDREKNLEILNEEILDLASQQLWHLIPPLLFAEMDKESDPEIKKKLALTYGDVLSRAGAFADGYKQLYLLAQEYAEEEIGIMAKYLLYLLRARFEDPFIADFELRNLKPSMTAANPLTPYFLLTQIETALATAQYARMKELLAIDYVGFPEETAILKELRQADYWSGTGDAIKAYIGYQLLEKHSILQNKIYSLNGYCNTLYQQKQFEESATCYNRLSAYIKDKENLGMITFRKYMAELHYKKPAQMIDFFSRIENTYPGTDAGFRGAMKKTDIRFLMESDWEEKAMLHYKAFTEKGITREIREEASFKVALLLNFRNQKIECIKYIMRFLRNFRKGPLHEEGQALLIELFPDVIDEYVSQGRYMDALVLAKQNRKLFLKNWVDIGLLSDLAASYNSLGIYEEAAKIYLYLISLSSEDEKEKYYLPVIQSAFEHGSYLVVEDYADQYGFRYPNGRHKMEILKIRIESLLATEKYNDAIALLPQEIPLEQEFSMLAATLYFHQNDFKQVIDILGRPIKLNGDKRDRYAFMLAESYYKEKQFDLAEKYYSTIVKDSIHYDQALYRRAEYMMNNNEEDGALKLYKELAETGKSPLWIGLAQKAIEYLSVIN